MKHGWITLVFFLIIRLGSAQLVPSSNQSFQLMQSFNPSFTGIEDFTSLKIGYRNQWMTFPDAPRYVNMTFSTRIKQPADVIHNALRTGYSVEPSKMPLKERTIHAMGVSLTHEKFGVLENFDLGITYSFHLPISEKLKLAVGISPSLSNTKIQVDRLATKDPDRFIEYLQSTGSASNSVVNLRTGVVMYSKSLYVHFSRLNTWSHDLNSVTEGGSYHYTSAAGMGFNFQVSPTASVKPSVLALADSQGGWLIDYSVKAYFGHQAWGGLLYRNAGFASIILGFEFNTYLGVSYSYEISTAGMQGFNNGSNEIIVSLKLANLRKQNQYIW